MKIKLFLCVCGIFFYNILSAQFVEMTSTGFTFVGMYSGTNLSGDDAGINNSSRRSVFFDYDEDGDLDILVSEYGGEFDDNGTTINGSYKLYQNNRGTSFTELTTIILGLENPTNSFGDYDNDGYRDVFSGGYFLGADVYKVINQQNLSFEQELSSQIHIEHIPNNNYIIILSSQNQEILLIEKLQIQNE